MSYTLEISSLFSEPLNKLTLLSLDKSAVSKVKLLFGITLMIESSNCQATGTGNGTGNRESRIETVPVLTVKSHGPPTTTPQLLEVKEWTDNKVPLVRMSQDDPLSPSSTKNNQVDSENNNQGCPT